jgi:hypothetical protein
LFAKSVVIQKITFLLKMVRGAVQSRLDAVEYLSGVVWIVQMLIATKTHNACTDQQQAESYDRSDVLVRDEHATLAYASKRSNNY